MVLCGRKLVRGWATLLMAAVALAMSPTVVIGQQPASRPASAPSLADRQAAVQERVQRLEATMLKLSKALEAQEPDKAERLRAALEQSGRERVRSRVEALVKLLRSQEFSEADRQQETLLVDLDSLLKTLTSRDDELQRRREERQRLEKLKRGIRVLMEDQTQELYHTQHAAKQLEGGEESGGQARTPKPGDPLSEQLRQLEKLQRDIQRRGDELNRDMQSKPGKPGESPPQQQIPGGEEMQRAAEQMRQAGDRLSESKPGDAKERQQESLDEMQKALDALDDALRQTRKDEVEQTLDALQTRLQEILAKEQEVSATTDGWLGKEPAARSPDDFVSLSEAAKTQGQAAELTAQTLSLLLDEGSTVVVPELLRQMQGDMVRVSGDLSATRPTALTQKALRDIIATLTELLDAIDKKRQQQQQDEQQQQQQQGEQDQTLLPKSAELKMLRASQQRLNERTPSFDEGAMPTPEQQALLGELSGRQRRLSDMTRRIYERK